VDKSEFVASTRAQAPPAGLSAPLVALWWLRKGDWTRAHEVVQPFETGDGAWVHAHLHRVEGDANNAAYWYRQAGRPTCASALPSEWDEIAGVLLER
jgi:hypothetical protein